MELQLDVAALAVHAGEGRHHAVVRAVLAVAVMRVVVVVVAVAVTLVVAVGHEHEVLRAVGRAVALEGHADVRHELLAHEPEGIGARVTGEDEVVRHAIPVVGLAVLVFVLVLVADGEGDLLATLVVEGHRDRGIEREVEGLRDAFVRRDPELEVALVVVELELDVAGCLAVRTGESRDHAVVRTVLTVAVVTVIVVAVSMPMAVTMVVITLGQVDVVVLAVVLGAQAAVHAAREGAIAEVPLVSDGATLRVHARQLLAAAVLRELDHRRLGADGIHVAVVDPDLDQAGADVVQYLEVHRVIADLDEDAAVVALMVVIAVAMPMPMVVLVTVVAAGGEGEAGNGGKRQAQGLLHRDSSEGGGWSKRSASCAAASRSGS